MNKHIFRSCQEPIRIGLSFEERWRGPDKGLITCWEVGRDMSKKEPELAERARKGELPIIGWKGGVDKKIMKKGKYGTYNYLALWQGLRGDDLNIELTEEIEIVCSRTGMKVVYTDDATKYAEP
jgi:hypothetical protein